jgi:Cu/Ag efflux pump CusA
MRSLSDLHGAVKEGAVHRIRPKIMTVSAILRGLIRTNISHVIKKEIPNQPHPNSVFSDSFAI